MTTIRPRRAAILPALLLAPLLFPATAAAAVGDPRERLADPAQEARARAIGRELRCLVCQNQSIEDSNADLARDLRLIVRERIAQGATDAEVVRYLHERYGDFVLLRPPVTVATALLWAAPALALAGGATAILLALRRRRVTPDAVVEEAAAPLTEAERVRLAAIEAAASERDRRPS